MNVGEQIKYYRKKKGITQQKLAELIGVQASAISKYEKDLVDVPYSKLVAIAEALNTDISNILNGDLALADALEDLHHIYKLGLNPEDYGYEVNDDQRVIMLKKYDSLNALGQKKANEYITDLSEQEKYTIPDEEENPR